VKYYFQTDEDGRASSPRLKKYGDKYKAEAKRLFLAGNACYAVSRRLRIDYATIHGWTKGAKREADRTVWRNAVLQAPSGSRIKTAREQNAALYSRLVRQDGDWLRCLNARYSSRRQDISKNSSRVNRAETDTARLSLLQKARREILKELPPVWCRKWEVQKRAGLTKLRSAALAKLPRCKMFLSGGLETYIDFTDRQLDWFEHDLSDGSTSRDRIKELFQNARMKGAVLPRQRERFKTLRGLYRAGGELSARETVA
jgi:hypothetical protein